MLVDTARSKKKNNLEQQRDTAADEYENSLLKLADDNVDYKSVINQMIKHKQTMVDAENTIELIDQIKADLESEVKEEE